MSYTVTNTREVQEMTPGGQSKKAYRVWLVTAKGATGVIDVSPGDWEAGKLKGILDDKATELDLAFTVSAGKGK